VDPVVPVPRPPTLLLAAAVVGLEALALVGLAVLELTSLDSRRLALGVSTALFFLLLAAGLGLCARGLAVVSSWARGPVVAAQLIVLLLATSFWGGETTTVSLVLLAAAALGLVGVLHPASTRALAADDA
jgi:peptidoglycan/LPS O-acetylase OafA/YrhL